MTKLSEYGQSHFSLQCAWESEKGGRDPIGSHQSWAGQDTMIAENKKTSDLGRTFFLECSHHYYFHDPTNRREVRWIAWTDSIYLVNKLPLLRDLNEATGNENFSSVLIPTTKQNKQPKK
jgi:hypothetical protein